jgi:hypothetical protein
MEGFRRFLESGTGKMVAGGVIAVAALLMVLGIRSYFGSSSAADLSRDRVFICSETGKPFNHSLQYGEAIPIKSPHSGKETGYPAELCYWTKEGAIKDKPTPVLLRSLLGEKGPTFCPDCGRLVVGHNPKPNPGDNPPPTEGEYRLRRGQRDRE